MKNPRCSCNFYRIVSGKTLHSFKDAIADVTLVDTTLASHQNAVISSLEGRLIEVESHADIKEETPYFYFDENLFFTLEFAKKALEKSKDTSNSIQYCLAHNTFNERFVLPHCLEENELILFDFFMINPKAKEVTKVVLEQEIFENFVELPNQIVKGRKFHMDQCDTFASHIISPFHLLQVNLALNLNRSIRLQRLIPKKWRAKTQSKWTFKALKRLNKIGKNVSIHPTAIIEGSVIGANSIVGANAVVRLSIIGENCKLSENTAVMNSVIGNGTHISNSNYILNCVTDEEVFLIHGPYQFSIFGKNVACFAVINADIRLDQQNIKIPTSLGVIDSKQPLLGIAYGHRSKTGGGSIIAAGRIVPNDYIINPPDSIILKFEDL